MFAYCLNNPVNYSDSSGTASAVCLSEFTNPFTPPTSEPGGGGGLPPRHYTTRSNYGAVEDKLFTVQLLKYVTNSDAQTVINAKFLAFYKGVPVVKVPSLGTSGVSFGIIFLGSDVQSADVVCHEYGHTVQLRELGVPCYTSFVVVPSVYYYRLTIKENSTYTWADYYNRPWEYTADVFGGVTWDHSSWANDVGAVYWTFVKLISLI